MSRVMIAFGLAVEATTMSASRRCAAMSSSPIAKPWNSAASSWARSMLRLATIMRRRPSACRWRAASAIGLAGADHQRGAVLEARRTRSWPSPRRRRRPRPRWRRSAVSVRTRLATEKAAWNRRFSSGPGRAGVLRRAVGVLELAEDLRLAEHHRVEAGGDGEHVRDGAHVVVVVEAVVDARCRAGGSAAASRRARPRRDSVTQ